MPSSRRTLPTGPLVKGGESGDRGIAPPQNAARKKRQPAVRQSLRHGLRPCPLPLTREAKLPQTLRYPHPCRGRYSHCPGDPAPPQTSNFEIAAVRRAKSPALRNGENGAANRKTTPPAQPAPPVGADSISARFTAAQGPAGGIDPAPTNQFYVLGRLGQPQPPGRP